MAKIHKNNGKKHIEIRASRVTIDSRVCNTDKFNELYSNISTVETLKNQMSDYCFTNIVRLIKNPYNFKLEYKNFSNSINNAWEIQTLFQSIANHYEESAKRYFDRINFNRYEYKTKTIVNKKNPDGILVGNNVKVAGTSLQNIMKFIELNSNLVKIPSFIGPMLVVVGPVIKCLPRMLQELAVVNPKDYILDFNGEAIIEKLLVGIKEKQEVLVQLDKTIEDYDKKKLSLESTIKTRLEYLEKTKMTITSINLLELEATKLTRITNLIISKKLRAMSYIKHSVYKTGTHTQSMKFSNCEIIKDLTNGKYQYFLKVKRQSLLAGRKPIVDEKKLESLVSNKEKETYVKLQEEKLVKFNELNFLYLPLLFNKTRLKSIDKLMSSLLTKDNPQVLIKSTQLRHNQHRKIHVIFNYTIENELSKLAGSGVNPLEFEATHSNTLGLDINLKHNLLMDSNGVSYNEIIQSVKFISSVDKIVSIYSKPMTRRTDKEKINLEKLLRVNENLIKRYLSGLVNDWKSTGIKHLVLENLNILNDKSEYTHASVKIKYTRLAKLLRISQIKHWLFSIGEKNGLFVHWVNPAYTSQECSCCHHIEDKNRTAQEDFTCVECEFSCNADINAAINIKSRFLNKELNKQLNDQDVLGRVKPKTNIYYKIVKTIVTDCYLNNNQVESVLE